MSAIATARIRYPSSDGKPMGETYYHVSATILLIQAMEDFWRPRDPHAFIIGNMFWYYRKGEPKARVAPDTMVFPGVGAHPRMSYKSWEEPRTAPAVVFELTSKKTRGTDAGFKYELYEKHGVEEYYQFDPTGLLSDPVLRGHGLRAGTYEPLPLSSDGRLVSRFGFACRAEGQVLRFFDAATGEPIPTREEAVRAARAEVDRLRVQLGQAP